MKHKHFRALAWIFTLCTLIPVAASCGDAADSGGSAASDTDAVAVQTETSVETEAIDPLEARKLVDDELGEVDLQGYTYRIATSAGHGETLFCEAMTGDTIDDAVFMRNAAVEDRFNCNIVLALDRDYATASAQVTKAVKAGEDAHDIVSMHVVQLGMISLSDYFMNWYDIPHIDFDKPWWSASTKNDLTYNDVCVTAIGDMALSAFSAAYCVFYNKTLGANYDFPDLYDVVNSGKWTIDYVTALTKDIYADLNSNGAVDLEEDLFGYTSDCNSNLNAYLWAFDNPVFKKNGDTLEYTYKTEKITGMITKLCDMFSLYDGIQVGAVNYKNVDGQAGGHAFGRDMFLKGQSVLANGYISMSLSHFRDLEDEFGILPYPKWDEAQTNYYTMADGLHEALAIPKTVVNTEAVGIITEAMNAESYKILVPAYYDVALKVKSTRDEQSVTMLDLIVDSRVFDFGYVYDAWGGASFIFEGLVRTNNTNFESYYAEKESKIQTHYDKVIAFFEEFDS